jgi:NAD(P)-dependent dehydrogenase (short-subunit alcohol dehydrogenase family)
MTAQVALVTGASSGIGEATARRLHERGYAVYATARRVDRMAALEGSGVTVVGADVTDDASLVALVERIAAEAERIDVLVNNAGYGSYGALEEVPMAEARRQMDVNVFGLARLTQLVLPHMRAQGSGYIVNISSMGAKMYEPLGAWYHATKFAVEGLSDCLRLELAPFGIRVVVIEPGAIKTEWATIAAQSVLAVSGQGAYAAQAAAVGAVLGTSEGRLNLASSPDVVARAVVRAVTARRPKTRYVVGAGARPILALRRILPDRAFDTLMMLPSRLLGRTARGRPSP